MGFLCIVGIGGGALFRGLGAQSAEGNPPHTPHTEAPSLSWPTGRMAGYLKQLPQESGLPVASLGGLSPGSPLTNSSLLSLPFSFPP